MRMSEDAMIEALCSLEEKHKLIRSACVSPVSTHLMKMLNTDCLQFLCKNRINKSFELLKKLIKRPCVLDHLDPFLDVIIIFEPSSHILFVVSEVVASQNSFRNEMAIRLSRMRNTITNPVYARFYICLDEENIGIS